MLNKKNLINFLEREHASCWLLNQVWNFSLMNMLELKLISAEQIHNHSWWKFFVFLFFSESETMLLVHNRLIRFLRFNKKKFVSQKIIKKANDRRKTFGKLPELHLVHRETLKRLFNFRTEFLTFRQNVKFTVRAFMLNKIVIKIKTSWKLTSWRMQREIHNNFWDEKICESFIHCWVK